MAANDNPVSETLQLIRAAKDLLKSEKNALATNQDCDYFRNLYRTMRETPSQPFDQPIVPIKNPIAEKKPLSAPAKTEAPTPPPISVEKPSKESGFDEIQKLLSSVFPDLVILPDIPSDMQARQIANRWKTKNQSAPLSVLSFREPALQQKILINLAHALDVTFGGARWISAEEIEKENQWEAFLSVRELKLVIICDCALWQMPHLLQYYREVPSHSERFLLKAPLMLLPDLTLYLKDPLLKRSLWKALCQKIGN